MTFNLDNRAYPKPSTETLVWAAQARRALQERSAARTAARLGGTTTGKGLPGAASNPALRRVG